MTTQIRYINSAVLQQMLNGVIAFEKLVKNELPLKSHNDFQKEIIDMTEELKRKIIDRTGEVEYDDKDD